eukprot:2207372-Rhodomonas_salina.2
MFPTFRLVSSASACASESSSQAASESGSHCQCQGHILALKLGCQRQNEPQDLKTRRPAGRLTVTVHLTVRQRLGHQI